MTDRRRRDGEDSPLNHVRTTSQLLRQSTSSLTSNPITFLFLTFLIFSFRCVVDHCSLLLTSFIDHDPSIRSLLSRVPLHPPQSRHHHNHRRHRPPFLHLTRVSTLDDEFFSAEDEDPHRQSVYGLPFRHPPNGTFVFLSGFDVDSGFPYPIADNGLQFPQIIRHGVAFRYPSRDEKGYEKEEEPARDPGNDEHHGEKNEKSAVDMRLLIRGLELDRHDVMGLFFLVSILSAAYGWMILGFTTIYSLALGIVYITVVNDSIGKFCSFVGVVWSGSRLGLKRVAGLIMMRWAMRDALTQLLGLWYFGEVEDQASFFRLFVRLKLMPFTVVPPWNRSFQEISGFLLTWFLLDTFIGLILAVDAYVTIADSRRRGREILKEGLYMVSILLNQALLIKCLEALLGGLFTRWVMVRAFGTGFAAIFQSALEVYFMVTWLIFYLAARCKDADMQGGRFGRRELEGLINDGLR